MTIFRVVVRRIESTIVHVGFRSDEMLDVEKLTILCRKTTLYKRHYRLKPLKAINYLVAAWILIPVCNKNSWNRILFKNGLYQLLFFL